MTCIFVDVFILGNVNAAGSNGFIAVENGFVDEIAVNGFETRFDVAVVLDHDGRIDVGHDRAKGVEMRYLAGNLELRPSHNIFLSLNYIGLLFYIIPQNRKRNNIPAEIRTRKI